MISKYTLIAWLCYVVFKAILFGYKTWRNNVKKGYDPVTNLEFYNGFSEGLGAIMACSLGTLFLNPLFWICQLPALGVMWLISYIFKI